MTAGAAAEAKGTTGGDALERDLEPLLDAGYRLALVMLRERHEAQDATQDAAVLAWRRVGQLRDPALLRSWFLSIVANECRSRLRRPWRAVAGLAADIAAPFSEDAIVSGLDVSAALARLPARDRLALYLHYYEDLTVSEAARVAGCREAAFRSRLYRAVARLRDLLAEPEGTP